MRIAVVGSGISGLGAAWALAPHHDVTLFEAGSRVGGHSRTVEVTRHGRRIAVDTGFIVYNEPNYPNLVRFLDALGVATAASDMSFAVSAEAGDLEYGGRLGALFSRPRAVIDPRMWDIIRGIVRFRKEQTRLAAALVPPHLTISEYLHRRGYPSGFGTHYLFPLAAAVWSGTRNDAASLPATTFLSFLNNHGLVEITGRPLWRTVAGGSRSYVDRAVARVGEVFTNRGVRSVRRDDGGAVVTDVKGVAEDFDHVVLATHADTALRILGEEADPEERRILKAFRYDRNEVVLHTDTSLMPQRRRVWSSWNCIATRDDDGSHPVLVSYWMNRLQPLATGTDLIVTLNPGQRVAERAVIDRWVTNHPQFDPSTDRAQLEMRTIQGRDRIWFAGAYLGYGFHEDGLQAGLTVAAALGAPAPWHDEVTPASPAARNAAPFRVPVPA